jgi:hypothetical protein
VTTPPPGYGPSQQPPAGWGPPPPGYGPPGYGPPQPPPRKSSTGKKFLLGCGGLTLLIILIVIIAVVASNSGGPGSGTATSGSPSASSGSSGASAQRIGAKARDGKFQFVVTSVGHTKNVGDVSQGLGDTAHGEFTVLHVAVTNIGGQAQILDDSAQYVYDGKGRQFSANSSADIDGNSSNGGGVFFNQINPGVTVHGSLYFDLPAGDKATRAVLHDSAFSDGVTVSLLP